MTRPLPLLAVAALLGIAPCPGTAQTISPAPVPGPVGLSVGNESRMALMRAERWLERHATDSSEDYSVPGIGTVPDEEVTRLLPLLEGDSGCLHEGENMYEAWERLVAGLSRQGLSMVYRDGTWVEWRKAVLHALVISQHPDDMGGGWWGDGQEDAWQSTRTACKTLRFLLGLQDSAD